MHKLPQKITILFASITAALILIQIIILYLISNSNLNPGSGFVNLFDLNKERNVPSVFSTLGLFLSAFILLKIALKESGLKRFCWFTLTFIFLFLSYDELFSFHESLIKPIRSYLHVSGYLYFAWVIPYGIATFILLFIFYRFLQMLPQRIKWQMILSGFIYVLGALGFELLGAKQYVSDGEIQTQTFRILYTIEESLEMTGVLLFLRTISKYLITLSKTNREPKIIQLPELQGNKHNDYRNTGSF